MILPIYVSLEKIDFRLTEAAADLYGTPWTAFRKVVLPLSLPGVFAGSLLVFIPAAGDYLNNRYLGSPKTSMIGTVVQNKFLVQFDYPQAAALSHRADGDHHGDGAHLLPVPGHGRTGGMTGVVVRTGRDLPCMSGCCPAGVRGGRGRSRHGVDQAPAGRAPAGAGGSSPCSRSLVYLYLFAAADQHRRLHVQQARGSLQPVLGAVHARELGQPVQGQGTDRRLPPQPPGGLHRRDHRRDHGVAHGHRPGPLPVHGQQGHRDLPGAAAHHARDRAGCLAVPVVPGPGRHASGSRRW